MTKKQSSCFLEHCK